MKNFLKRWLLTGMLLSSGAVLVLSPASLAYAEEEFEKDEEVPDEELDAGLMDNEDFREDLTEGDAEVKDLSTITDITFSVESLTLQMGGEKEISVTTAPTDFGGEVLEWTIEDEDLAEVNNGQVLGLDVGTTKLTVSTPDGRVSNSITVKVIPTKPTLKGVTAGEGKFAAQWTKLPESSHVDGYQVQYSTNKTFSKSKTKTAKVAGRTVTKRTVNSLTSGKTYYVRVRSYKTIDGKNYVSSWSNVKSVKVK